MKTSRILLLCVVFALCACNSRKADFWLERAMQLVEEQPQKALDCLDSITYPRQDLRAEGYRQYTVTKVHALWMLDKDISHESDIFAVRDYYAHHGKNHKMMAHAYLYSGCVYEENDQKKDAMEAYNMAFDAAQQANDSLLMGRAQQYIGRWLFKQGLYQEALEPFRSALEFYKTFPNKQIDTYNLISTCFLLLQENDSAYYYYQKGLDLVEQLHDNTINSNLLLNLSVYYRVLGDYPHAEASLKQAIDINTDTTQNIRFHLNLAELYLQTGQIDSCNYYEGLLKKELSQIKDPYLLTSICSFLADKAYSEKELDSTYYYMEKYISLVEDITNERLKQSVYDVQKRYDYEKAQNVYSSNLAEKQETILYLLCGLLIATIFIFFFGYKLIVKNKTENELHDKIHQSESKIEELREVRINLEQSIESLNASIKALEQENSSQIEQHNRIQAEQIAINNKQMEALRDEMQGLQERYKANNTALENNLKQRIDLLCKLNKIKNNNTNSEQNIIQKAKINIYGSEKGTIVDALFMIFDDTYPNMAKKIRQRYPDLTETEYKVCLLSFLFNNIQDIADVLGQSYSNTGRVRTVIRKKIGMNDAGGDFCASIRKELHF